MNGADVYQMIFKRPLIRKRSFSYLLLNSWKISRSWRYGPSCGRHPISGYLAIFLGFHILDIWWPVPWMATNPRLGTWWNPDTLKKLYSKKYFLPTCRAVAFQLPTPPTRWGVLKIILVRIPFIPPTQIGPGDGLVAGNMFLFLYKSDCLIWLHLKLMERGGGKYKSIICIQFCKIIFLCLRANFFWSAKSIDGNDVLSHLRVNGLSWFFSVKGAMKGYHTKGFHRVLRNFLHDLSFFSTHFQ